MEWKSEETRSEVVKADKRRNPFRFEADVLLTGLREWDKGMNVSESFFEGMPEAREPVDSPAYQ